MSAGIHISPKGCTLQDLPPPPAGRHGWPWDSAPDAMPEQGPGGKAWPKISIITPSFNQGQYIEETIRSILLQGYPDLEYHIIDGGSNDATVEIIRKYEPWLSSWVSEKDKGQSDAINKGFAKCDGEIFNWICSDDVLAAGALHSVALEFMDPAGCDVLAGACFCQYDKEPEKSEDRSGFQEGWLDTPYMAGIWQPSCFYRSELISRADLLRRDLHYCMDRELWCYFWKRGARWKWTETVLSRYRFTGENKSVTGGDKIIGEIAIIFEEYMKASKPLSGVLRKIWLPLVMAGIRRPSGFVRLPLRILSRSITGVLLALYPRAHVRALQKEFYVYSVW